MKKVTKFFMAALLAGICSFGYAQDCLNEPKQYEIVIENVSKDGYTAESNFNNYFLSNNWYKGLLQEANEKYPNIQVDIRNLKIIKKGHYLYDKYINEHVYFYHLEYKIVDIANAKKNADFYNAMNQSTGKALSNVREGSRLAIDQVTITSSMDRGEFKDLLIDVLLDKGYKVVAKEYLEKLYEEQQAQQSGIYNDQTTVQENNFSAVGYYINVKVTETSLRVQVVNVSTGEYEGNATVNF